VAGPLADRTRRFWAFTIAGYTLTLVSVPLLAVSGHLGVAVGLFMAERLGKAIRTPARDTMLAGAGADIGRGWAFAVHEALDQFGAVLGPLLVAAAVAGTGRFAPGFAVLAVPGVLCLALLLWLRREVPDPLRYEQPSAPSTAMATQVDPATDERFSPAFWRYLTFAALAIAGLAPFALASYHAEARNLLSAGQVPLLYALAMAVDAVVALVAGRAYDRRGLSVLVVLPLLAAAVPPTSFSSSTWLIWLGAAAWGAAMGLHESVLRAAVGDLSGIAHRATAYGVFTAVYGAASLAGDTLIGVLYDRSVTAIVVAVAVIEVAALLALPAAARARHRGPSTAR
jgi:MFS family permease